MTQRLIERQSRKIETAVVFSLLLTTLSFNLPAPLSAADSTITITPSTVSCADSLVVDGEGFPPDSQVIISTGTSDDIPETVFDAYWGPATVDEGGSFVIEGIRPILNECIGLSPEPHFLTVSTATDDSLDGAFGAPTATASFAVSPEPDDPRLILSPDQGSGCIEVTAFGENFEPGTVATLLTNEFPGNHTVASLGEATVAENGTFSFVLPQRSTPFVACDDGPLPGPRDGQRYLVWASTGQSKVGEGLHEPSAGHVFTVALGSEDRFQAVWSHTDLPVDEGAVRRTWMWGPSVTGVMSEPYTESPDGQRAVQYFDKSRMEITHPDAAESDWYVTNGLLVVELISGEIQVGDENFISRFPSESPVAGDPIPRNGPSYATFRALMESVEDRQDSAITEILDWEGAVTTDPGLESRDIRAAYYDDVTGHNVAAPFWEFMNSSDTIWKNGEFVEGPLFPDSFYATGRPIIEAYWADVTVAGTDKLVLLQCFERRCLTYTPDNPEGWQVEAGNVGQHYYQWRYGSSTGNGLVLFEQAGDLFSISAGGTGLANLTEDFSLYASDAEWSPDGTRIAFVGSGNLLQEEPGMIFVMNADGTGRTQITDGPYDSAPSWSPDGSQIAFARLLPDMYGPIGSFSSESKIFVVESDGSNERQITDIPTETDFSISQSPAWSPDGQWIAFSNVNGTAGPGPLDSMIYIVRPDGSELTALAESAGNGQPIWSPSSDAVVYEKQPGGSSDFEGQFLWYMDLEDRQPVPIAGGDRSDPDDPDWSPDGDAIVYWRHAERFSEETELVRYDVSTMETTIIAHFGRVPAWSPDGETLAVVAPGGIVVMNPDGTVPVLIHGGGSSPQWQPVE